MIFEVREIDAWRDGDGWTWNTSYQVGRFATNASDERRAFTMFLKRHGVVFRKGKTRIDFDGSVLEIVDRKTGEPLYAAIPMEAN